MPDDLPLVSYLDLNLRLLLTIFNAFRIWVDVLCEGMKFFKQYKSG